MSSMKSSKIQYMISNRFQDLWDLKQKREKRKIPLLEISRETGIPYKTIYDWAHNPEAGRTVSINVVEALCRYFDCSVGALLVLGE